MEYFVGRRGVIAVATNGASVGGTVMHACRLYVTSLYESGSSTTRRHVTMMMMAHTCKAVQCGKAENFGIYMHVCAGHVF